MFLNILNNAQQAIDGPGTITVRTRREGDEEQPWVQPLIDAYHSPEIKAFIDEKYHGTVLTSW